MEYTLVTITPFKGKNSAVKNYKKLKSLSAFKLFCIQKILF